MFAILGAFMVFALVLRKLETDDISGLAGLNQRSPLLATTLTLAMVSLAGIPPLAGFLGKFFLLRALVAQGAVDPIYYWLTGVAIFGVVVSLYYYFGVVREVYWSKDAIDLSAIQISKPAKLATVVCIAGMLWLGLFPSVIFHWADAAVKVLAAVKM
jgi:NADH-quinone oxidoreductase subunit N